MSLLYRIIYAAHANGTHHKLALDALMKLRHPQADGWRNVMLKHVALYLEGSKDPDNKFKDFKNHVLHVRDGYWGGAPEKVQNWYQHLVTALQAANWSEAAYAAGVLSHYYTDPIHPFHTGQTEAENNVHRAVEWSINRSYDALQPIAREHFAALDVPVPAGPEWLREMTCNGAEFSNRYYEKLIAHYDMTRGVVDPPAGLDQVSRRFVAELLAYASTGFARILDRAFSEAGHQPPEVALALDTVIAALQIPAKMLQKRLSDAADREIVQRMYDEMKATGTVEANLPEDDRQVRDLFVKEVEAPRAAAQARARAARIETATAAQPPQPRQRTATTPPAAAIPATAPVAAKPVIAAAPAAKLAPQPQSLAAALAKAQQPPETEAPAETAPASPASASAASMNAVAMANAMASAPRRTEPVAATPAPEPGAREPEPKAETKSASPRFHLAASDDLEAAPSIGAKTAHRFAAIGVKTVNEFLDNDPAELATILGQRSLTTAVLTDWQAQSRLMLAVPGLRGTHAQLLVGAGYRDADAIIDADAGQLCADILSYAMTPPGQRLLRDGATPDIEKIRTWIEDATAYAKAA